MGNTLNCQEAQKRIEESFQQNVKLISEYKSRREKVKLQCLDCGHIWEITATNVMYRKTIKNGHQCPNCGINAKNKQRQNALIVGKDFIVI